MKKNSLKKLEYFNILEKLSKFASTYIGKDLCLNTLPTYSYEEVLKLQARVDEAFSFYIKYGLPPISNIPDISKSLEKLEINYTLSIKNIIEISSILKLSESMQTYFFSNDGLNTDDFPILNDFFSKLYTNVSLIKDIDHAFIDENTLDDKASSKLFELRKKHKILDQEIKDKLNFILHSSKYQKYIQEQVITIRNDRYVIPVKNEYRSYIKGFVHDISDSGATVFIEPVSIFEINNEINNIKIEESIEIERILMELSNKLSPIASQIKNTIYFIGNIDYIFAKVKYSKSINGISPILNKNKEINLIDARNPLIDEKLVVPVSIKLGRSFNTLVITGPNTGGKTVTLKTVGLLCLMAYSGIYIPAKEKSTLPVFDKIFADIGDDQSIQESLSTFSSHITNIVDIVNNISSNSLILVDELGSGTDPVEGSVLAISLLEYFQKLGCLTIATTHYTEIKEYALVADGFENASSEFDIENLKPTYHLVLGVPGRSNALEISKQLGLSSTIIERAKTLVDSDIIHIEELLKSIYDSKILIEHEKEEIQKKSNEIDLLKYSLENKSNEVQLKKNKIIEDAKKEARDILLKAKEESSLAIKEINKLKNLSFDENNKDLNNIRNSLNSSIKALRYNNNTLEKDKNNIAYELEPNINVYVSNLNQYGTILSVSKNSDEVQVQIGNNKLKINKMYIVPSSIPSNKAKAPSKVHFTSSTSNKHAATEINILGMTVEEAISLVDKFLDDAALQRINTVRIVHGKGTGALKKGIHKFLKTHSHVSSFRLGTFGEGEMGVTIVEIK